MEVPHTSRGTTQSSDVPAEGADPAHLAALARAGFGVATLAGNHIYDQGDFGIRDTVDGLRAVGVAPVGAGMNLAEALEPAVVERAGVRFGVLSFNCVGPRDSWAGVRKAGCAYVHVLTHYELDHASPGGPPSIYTFAELDSLERMMGAVEALRPRCDVLLVAFHKGIGHVPAAVAQYEKQVGRAAIDAGADLVVSHHPHICRGVEVYRGRAIFHGLGNFVTVTHALSLDTSDPQRAAWAKRRKQLYGFEPDPETPEYPFHPESRNTLIARLDVHDDGSLVSSFQPCFINRRSQPEVLGHDARGEQVAAYLADITHRAGLRAGFAWDGDRVAVHAP